MVTVVLFRWWSGIDRETQTIGGCLWSTFIVAEAKADTDVFHEGMVVDEDGEVTIGFSRPLEIMAEEEVGFSYEIDFDSV